MAEVERYKDIVRPLNSVYETRYLASTHSFKVPFDLKAMESVFKLDCWSEEYEKQKNNLINEIL